MGGRRAPLRLQRRKFRLWGAAEHRSEIPNSLREPGGLPQGPAGAQTTDATDPTRACSGCSSAHHLMRFGRPRLHGRRFSERLRGPSSGMELRGE